MRRPFRLLVVLAVVAAGCGGEDSAVSGAADNRSPAVPRLSLAEAQSVLERRGDVALVREAIGEGKAEIATELDPAPADSRRLAAQNGREFDLLLFTTPDAAREAWESLLDTTRFEEGAAAVRAVNVVAVFPERADRGVYARVKQVLREVAVACRGEDGDEELRSLCFEDGEDPGPPGDGTDLDELAPIGTTIQVQDVEYTVTTARQLNPRVPPDEDLVDLRPGDGRLFFGVFLRACNPDGPRVPQTSDALTLVSATGHRARPVELPATNPFAYAPAALEPDDCLPENGSVADRATDGTLVLFEVPADRLEDRPLGLEIVSPDGTGRATVQLDV